jgi:segregation and condensation protein B
MRPVPASPAAALQTVSQSAGLLRPYRQVRPRKLFCDNQLRPAAPPPVATGQAASGRNNEVQRLEAVLLLAREPLASRKLAQLAHLEDGTLARTLVRKLNQLYDHSGRAFRVEEVAGGYQLLTRPKFATWLRRLSHVPSENRLSSPALETLSVVAYRQPVAKADIEAIRGVHCGEVLRQLMERDLVRIAGRSEELGRPYLYATSKRFLQQFGMRSLEELPRAEILRSASVPPVVKAADSGHHTASCNWLSEGSEFPGSIVDKESDVSVTLSPALSSDEVYESTPSSRAARGGRKSPVHGQGVRLEEDDDFDDEEDDDLDDDLDDEEDEEDEELDEEEDFEDDEEWEEVEDEDDELDEDEDDEDWDDEEDEDWDDEEDDDFDDEEEEALDEEV